LSFSYFNNIEALTLETQSASLTSQLSQLKTTFLSIRTSYKEQTIPFNTQATLFGSTSLLSFLQDGSTNYACFPASALTSHLHSTVCLLFLFCSICFDNHCSPSQQ